MAKDNHDLIIASSDEESTDDSGDNDNEMHLTHKQLKEKNFRLSLAQQSNNYKEILKCKTEEEFHKSLDSQSHKSLRVILKALQNVYRGENVKDISQKKFNKIKMHETHLVQTLSNIKISKMKKDSIKGVLKSMKLPLLKRLLKIHKKCGLSDYEF